METQQKIVFPPGTFEKVRANEAPAYIAALEKKIKKLELSNRSLKGHFTKQQKRKQPNT